MSQNIPNDTVICISREYGSGGREIAETLAQKLNIPCYDKLLIQKAAKESGCSEEFLNELKHEYEDFMRVNYPQENIRKTLNEIGFNFIGVNEDFNIDKYSMPKSKNSVNRIDYNYIAFNNFNSNTVQSKNELTQAAA